MHEVSLMQDTLILAQQRAKAAQAERIHSLRMRVGALSGVVPESLEFAFEILAKGTMAEGATLCVERVPIVCFCASCDREFPAANLYCECPGCQQPSVDVRQGRELELTSLEVS